MVNLRLRAERLNAGLTVEQLANELGISKHILDYAEGRGGRPGTPATAKIIADYFDLKVTDIWPIEDRTETCQES